MFLFLFVVDALSALITKSVAPLKKKKNKSVADDGLKGIKICRGARVISQLLFADDTILLFEVSSSQAIYCERFVEQLHVSDGSTYYMKAIY